MTLVLADYHEERALLDSLFVGDCTYPILLFRGESGTGKTSLLMSCLDDLPADAVAVPIQLRGSVISISEVFYRLGSRLGWNHLSRFTAEIAHLQRLPALGIDKNWLLGINNHISVALHSDNPADNDRRQAALTEAWFNDLSQHEHPLVIAFDAFEHATTRLAEWISGPFLSRVAQSSKLRVIVAGQDVPDANNIEWGGRCRQRDLFGVHEAQHWMPVVEELGRNIDVDPPDVWLAGVCAALNGRPKEIRMLIESLPRTLSNDS